MIPKLVTDDPKPKPYQTNLIKFNRDPDIDEDDDWWYDDDNQNKRTRNQETRTRKPIKRRKPNQPNEEETQTEEPNQGEKRKPKPKPIENPNKIRRIFKKVQKPTLTEMNQNQTKIPEEEKQHNYLDKPKPKQSQPNQTNPSEEHIDNQPNLQNPSPHSTLPQCIKSNLPDSVSTTDRVTDNARFMGLFNREGANITRNMKSRRKNAKGGLSFNCQDIHTFYSSKLQQPPPPAWPAAEKGKVSSKNESGVENTPGTDGGDKTN